VKGKLTLFSPDLVIRNAAVDEADSLRDIFRRASLTIEGDRELFDIHPDWLLWDEEMIPFTRVAVVDKRVVGFASARPADDFLELEDLFTDPDWMRKGVASALIEDIKWGGKRIEVTANPYAIEFYKSVGFITDGVINTQGGLAPRMLLDVKKE
jgi:GNAT superfamily N-acetyltransferase